jgi:hypothetical protein
MTLLEILLALVMLSALVIASAGLVHLAASAANATAGGEPWRAAADAALDAVARDIAAGDFDITPDPHRVEAHDGWLKVVTRGLGDGAESPGGPVVHEYRLDAAAGVLWRDEGPISPGPGQSPGRAERSRLVLGQVGGWSAQLNSETGILRVSVAGPHGRNLERRFATR